MRLTLNDWNAGGGLEILEVDVNIIAALILAIAALLLPGFLPELVGDAFPAGSEFPTFISRALIALGAAGVFIALLRRGA